MASTTTTRFTLRGHETFGYCFTNVALASADMEKEGFEATHLFDLENDPYEMSNLLNDPANAEKQARLYDVLQNWYRRVKR